MSWAMWINYMSALDDFLSGEEQLAGFSNGTLIILLGIIALSLISGIIARRYLFPILMNILSKTDRIDGRTLFAPRSLAWMIGFLIFHISIEWISNNSNPIWNGELMSSISNISWAAFVILMLVAAYRLVDYLDVFIVVEGNDIAARKSLASVAESVGRLAVFVGGVFIIAGLAGMDLNGLIAGLGITGLALALAAKDSVANIFGAISILVDQPFNVGDWIIVEGIEGEVVNIGLRTTMIRTGNDTIVTVPNSNITNSPVENFSLRRFRRIRPNFQFEDDCDKESLKKFCEILLGKVLSDGRAIMHDDSWVKITDSLPPKITASGNFYCKSSSETQREFKEEILLLAKVSAKECNISFHEPRQRK